MLLTRGRASGGLLVEVADFHWNLWSNFGSRPFHALLLAIYLVFSASIIGWIHTRAA